VTDKIEVPDWRGGEGLVVRGSRGQLALSPAKVARDAEACRLRTRGLAYREIALVLGYSSESAVRQAVKRILDRTAGEASAELRALELARLDVLWRAALEVLEAYHVAVNDGKVIYLDEDGPPLVDHIPVLHAIDRMLSISQQRARLTGLNAPTRVQVLTMDVVDAEIARLTAELGSAGPESSTAGAAAGAEGASGTQG
jgi:hypothetical protein